MLNDVVMKHYGGMACDFTGGIVQVPDHSFLLFSAVIPSPGGGVLPVLQVLTNSKSASALESSLLRWQQFVQNHFDINHFAPHSIMTDDDAAETKALNAVFNCRTIGSVLDSLKAELRNLREVVAAGDYKVAWLLLSQIVNSDRDFAAACRSERLRGDAERHAARRLADKKDAQHRRFGSGGDCWCEAMRRGAASVSQAT